MMYSLLALATPVLTEGKRRPARFFTYKVRRSLLAPPIPFYPLSVYCLLYEYPVALDLTAFPLDARGKIGYNKACVELAAVSPGRETTCLRRLTNVRWRKDNTLEGNSQ